MSFCLWWQHPGLHKKCQVASQGWVLEVPNMVLNGQFMCFFNDGMMHALFLRLVSSLFFSCLPKKYEAVVRPRSHSPQRKKKQVPTKALHRRLSSVAAKPQKKGPSSATFCDGFSVLGNLLGHIISQQQLNFMAS